MTVSPPVPLLCLTLKLTSPLDFTPFKNVSSRSLSVDSSLMKTIIAYSSDDVQDIVVVCIFLALWSLTDQMIYWWSRKIIVRLCLEIITLLLLQLLCAKRCQPAGNTTSSPLSVPFTKLCMSSQTQPLWFCRHACSTHTQTVFVFTWTPPCTGWWLIRPTIEIGCSPNCHSHYIKCNLQQATSFWPLYSLGLITEISRIQSPA